MINSELLIPVTLVGFGVVIAMTASHFTPRAQRSVYVSRIALAALILTMIAALPTLITGPTSEPSVGPLTAQVKAHASRSEEPRSVRSSANLVEAQWSPAR